jgi:hypothetical protein
LIIELAARRLRYDQLRRPVELLLREYKRGLRFLEPGDPGMQQAYLIFDILHGLLQLPAAAPGLRLDAAHRGLGCLKICFRGIDGRHLHCDRIPKWLLVQFNKKISLVHAIVVIHQNTGDLTVDAGGEERHMAVHKGVVGRNRAEHEPDPRNAKHRSRNDDSAERAD